MVLVQSCCYANQTYWVFFTFSLLSASLDLKVPIILIIIVVVVVVVVAVDTCGHMRDRVCNALSQDLDHPPFHHT